MENPSHCWIIGLYKITGMDKISETQNRFRNICS